MNVSIRQIHPVFVGEVSGIDISRPLSRDEIAAVEAGMERYALLAFLRPKPTPEGQKVVSPHFRPLAGSPRGNITQLEDDTLPVRMEQASTTRDARRPLH